MGVKLLTDILLSLVNEFRESVAEFFLSFIDFSTVFNCVETFQDEVGVDISPVVNTVFLYAFYLLALKFVWKLFDTYILGANGNDDAEPIVFIVNLGKAIFISLAFGLLFSKLMSVSSKIATDILASIKMKPLEADNILEAIILEEQTSLMALLMLIVYVIMSIVLAITFIQNAIQLVVLRVGISFSVVGLLDSDGGVFKPYMKKFFQICWAAILQVIFYKLSMYALSQFSWLWAFSLLLMAIKAPAWLSEFILTNPGGGGKLQQALYSFSIIRSFKKA